MPSLQSAEIPADILDRARTGDPAAHEHIYKVLSRPVYTLIRRLVVRPAIAEELLQDAFVEIFCSMPSYRGTGAFNGWVRSIAVNKSLMYLRSPWHRGLAWIGVDSVAALNQTAVADLIEPVDGDLERALAALPDVSRTIVWLHDVEEMTHAEIARLFDRTVSFSKAQLARAHKQLRERLKTASGGLTCMPISKTC
jgi:RNA polymerase sigma factor (sigma-70 family)